MCGIAGIFNIDRKKYDGLSSHLGVMNQLQKHRGPEQQKIWIHKDEFVGFAHQRLVIIDLNTGMQPMRDGYGNTVVYNGEIYNYIELRQELSDYPFRTSSDTEVILAAYRRWGNECVNHFRGMFSFAIWDENNQKLFCARDRFGIKPFYYTLLQNTLIFASEAKTLLPFIPEIKTNLNALKEYLVFQYCLGAETLFENIYELPAASVLIVENGNYQISKYWEVYYNIDFDHTAKYFEEKLQDLIHDSIKMHLRSDVPIGSYVSGGIDSGIISVLASKYEKNSGKDFLGFHGKFSMDKSYDESFYARTIAHENHFDLHEIDITSHDFINSIENIIYHLDFPVAGPGSFSQYHVSKLASKYRKVVLGGQGGDEIFGGYTRYLIAYFEQCIKAAIHGTAYHGNFIVTYESIIPNLRSIKDYIPLLQEFWRDGLFENLDKRYYRLINRASTLQHEIEWNVFGDYNPFEAFQKIFHGSNIRKESYFDSMTHFDFKTLLKGLLQVEDRMSMAHSLEARIPFLDHPIVEFAATIPSNIKFQDGTLKRVLINAMRHELPEAVQKRTDKMGFPVPLSEWLNKDIKDFVFDIFSSRCVSDRPYFNQNEILKSLAHESKFGRKIWGLLSLELWHRQFHDRSQDFRKLLNSSAEETEKELILI